MINKQPRRLAGLNICSNARIDDAAAPNETLHCNAEKLWRRADTSKKECVGVHWIDRYIYIYTYIYIILALWSEVWDLSPPNETRLLVRRRRRVVLFVRSFILHGSWFLSWWFFFRFSFCVDPRRWPLFIRPWLVAPRRGCELAFILVVVVVVLPIEKNMHISSEPNKYSSNLVRNRPRDAKVHPYIILCGQRKKLSLFLMSLFSPHCRTKLNAHLFKIF